MDFRFWTLGFKLLGLSFLVFRIVHLGILDFGLWTLDLALCAFDFELWTWGFGFRSLDFRFWTLGFGRWPLAFKLCTLDSGLWFLELRSRFSQKPKVLGLWAFEFAFWSWDVDILVFGVCA